MSIDLSKVETETPPVRGVQTVVDGKPTTLPYVACVGIDNGTIEAIAAAVVAKLNPPPPAVVDAIAPDAQAA